MADCRRKLISLALFWLISFFVSLSVLLILRFAFTECTWSTCRPCTISGTGQIDTCQENTEQYRYVVDVFLDSDTNEKELKLAETACFSCENTAEDLKQDFDENKDASCIYDGPGEDIRIVSSLAEGATAPFLSEVLLAAAILFALLFVIVMVQVFQTELRRLYPRFMSTAWMNLRSVLRDHRSSSRTSAPPGSTPEVFVTPPPAITSRRRISKLIEGSKLSVIEAKALHEDGWSCCICLEEKDDEEQIRPIARLKCNHATHSECLRIWLETGRAACCLCNADVFSDGTKEHSLSSQASSTSGGDNGLIGSLIVERTDRTPSSPATSVFIDVPQSYSDTGPLNDERDGDIESGA